MAFWKKGDGSDEKSKTPGVAGSSPGSGTGILGTGAKAVATAGVGINPSGSPSVMGGVNSSTGPTPSGSVSLGASGSNFGATPPSLHQEESALEKYGKVRSALGPGTVIQGKLSFDTPVRIDGKLSGEIYSSKVLIIGPSGVIDASITAAALVVMGAVKGKVKATERIEILPGGKLESDIETPSLVIEEGGFFSGACAMVNASASVTAQPSQVKTATSSTPVQSTKPAATKPAGSPNATEEQAGLH